MQIQIRVEKDKNHFVKKSFKTIDEAIAFLQAAKHSQTKANLTAWLETATGMDYSKINPL